MPAGKLAPAEAEQDAHSAEEMMQEENFYDFIKSVDESDFELHRRIKYNGYYIPKVF